MMYHPLKAYEIVDFRRELGRPKLDGVGGYSIHPGGRVAVQNLDGIQETFEDTDDNVLDEGSYLEIHTPSGKIVLLEMTLGRLEDFNEMQTTPQFTTPDAMHEYFMDLLRRGAR